MMKNEREKNWKATSQVNVDKNNDEDILNLNDDESFAPIEEEEKEPLSDEEKKEIRKKLFFLLVVIILVLAGLLIVLIANPFQKEASKKEEKEEETIEEKPEEPEETISPETAIKDLENGAVQLNNLQLQALEKEITVNSHDFFENDTVSLYAMDNTDIKTITDNHKLFLVSKTNDFKTLVESKFTNEDICNSNIIIAKTDIDKILNDRFNTTINKYDPFTYNIYVDDSYHKTIKFVYQNETYIGSCYTLQKISDSYAQQKVTSATKKDNQLYIDAKVVFINKTGVYKEPNFNTLITNVSQTFDEYIDKGNVYRYTYEINNDTFSLTNISLQK